MTFIRDSDPYMDRLVMICFTCYLRILCASLLLTSFAFGQEPSRRPALLQAALQPLEKSPEAPVRPTTPLAILGTPISAERKPLQLQEVLESVERYYPLLKAIEEERRVAAGRFLSALGAFDTNLRANSANVPLGTYENYRFSTGIDQAFTSTGLTAFTQYRTSYGDFPIYYGDRKTGLGGEFRAGVAIPLLKDHEIDRRRANLQQARLNQEGAEPVIDRQRLDFFRAAARVYWNWVASGERQRLALALAELARTRDKQLNELEINKLVSRIERVDNQQNIAARQTLLVDAQLRFQQASIELSLYLRDDNGSALMPDINRLARFPEPRRFDDTQFEAQLQEAYEIRPEIRRLRLQRESLEVELRWAINQTLPAVNAFVAGSQDMGMGKPSTGPSRLDRSSLDVGFEFQMPIQRRDAQGRVETTRAQLRQIVWQEQFARDAVRAELQSAFAALDRFYEMHEQALKRVALARQVAEAERQRLKDGDSDVLRVTLREQAAFDADVIEIGAKADFFRAEAEWKAALGTPKP